MSDALSDRARARGGSSPWLPHLRTAFLIGTVALVGGFLYYTNSLIRRLEDETAALTELIARFCASATLPASESEEVQRIFREIQDGIHFPIVITDQRGIPLAWKGIAIPADAIPYETYRDADPRNLTGPLKDIVEIQEDMDRRSPPIPMRRPGSPIAFGSVHYGESAIVRELQWVPLVQVMIVAAFALIGYLAFRAAKVSEQRSIWVGMAKETAHQLGTPISSLMGWLDLMEAKLVALGEAIAQAIPAPGDEGSPLASLDGAFPMIDEMRIDVERLTKVVSRFSNVGSEPKLEAQDIVPILHGTVEYVRARLPASSGSVRIYESYGQLPPVRVNKELLEWTLENLLKNAVDSLQGGGEIEVAARYDAPGERVRILVADNGRGMSSSVQKRIFQPGFTTKRRGWGLGLPLAKRIAEDYHGGKLQLESSQIGKGTSFSITLPL